MADVIPDHEWSKDMDMALILHVIQMSGGSIADLDFDGAATILNRFIDQHHTGDDPKTVLTAEELRERFVKAVEHTAMTYPKLLELLADAPVLSSDEQDTISEKHTTQECQTNDNEPTTKNQVSDEDQVKFNIFNPALLNVKDVNRQEDEDKDKDGGARGDVDRDADGGGGMAT